MPQPRILKLGATWYLYSFTDGCTKLRLPTRESEADVLARCLWLSNHGRRDEAEELLEAWCSRRR